MAVLTLVIATAPVGMHGAMAGTPPQPPPYTCDASRDGQQIWSDGYVWECKNVDGFYRWVIVGGGAGRPYIKEKVQAPQSTTGTWTVYAPQNPSRSQTLTMDYGDGSKETRTVNQGTSAQIFTFTHDYCSWICVDFWKKYGVHRVTASLSATLFDVALFWDRP